MYSPWTSRSGAVEDFDDPPGIRARTKGSATNQRESRKGSRAIRSATSTWAFCTEAVRGSRRTARVCRGPAHGREDSTGRAASRCSAICRQWDFLSTTTPVPIAHGSAMQTLPGYSRRPDAATALNLCLRMPFCVRLELVPRFARFAHQRKLRPRPSSLRPPASVGDDRASRPANQAPV